MIKMNSDQVRSSQAEHVRVDVSTGYSTRQIPENVQTFLKEGQWTLVSRNSKEKVSEPSKHEGDTETNSGLIQPPTLADIVKETSVVYPTGYGKAKPVFLSEHSVHGSRTPTDSSLWLKHEEIYLSLGKVISPDHISGIQRTGKFWRLYVDNEQDRVTVLTSGITIRGKGVSLLPENPNTPKYNPETTTKLRVSSIPLSADDGQIKRALTLQNCIIIDIYREKLRVNNRLTNCDTGDRIVIVQKLTTHLSRLLKVGKYNAGLWYYGQPKEASELAGKPLVCVKCKAGGHVASECQTGWKCNLCNEVGHRQFECKASCSELDASETEDAGDEEDEEEEGEESEDTEARGKTSEVTEPQEKHKEKDRKKMKSKKLKHNSTPSHGSLDRFLTKARQDMGSTTPLPTRDRSRSKQRTPPSPPNQNEHKKTKKKDNKA